MLSCQSKAACVATIVVWLLSCQLFIHAISVLKSAGHVDATPVKTSAVLPRNPASHSAMTMVNVKRIVPVDSNSSNALDNSFCFHTCVVRNRPIMNSWIACVVGVGNYVSLNSILETPQKFSNQMVH